MSQSSVPPETAAMPTESLTAKISAQIGKHQYPPVHLWNPPFCGDIDLRISADGRWFYLGTPINRPAMVKLFASVLRYDADGDYYLVTPVEKVRIQVEDVPLLAIDMEEGQNEQGELTLLFTTSVGDQVIADADHPIEMRTYQNQQRPYVLIRDNLYALIHRNLFYRMVNMANLEESGVHITSAGSRFFLGAI